VSETCLDGIETDVKVLEGCLDEPESRLDRLENNVKLYVNYLGELEINHNKQENNLFRIEKTLKIIFNLAEYF